MLSASIHPLQASEMEDSHPELATVGGSIDHAAHLASGARDRFGQQWQKCCGYKVDRGSIDKESFGCMVSIWKYIIKEILEQSTLLPKINRLFKHGVTELLRSIFRTRLGLCSPHSGIVHKPVNVISFFLEKKRFS